MSALILPDVSQYNDAIPAGVPVVIARASIGNVKDAKYAQFIATANARGIPCHAYHFLNSGKLGVSAQAQADFAFSVIGAGRSTMIDLEPNRGYCATLDEGLAFADRYRSNGGIVHLCYLPRWSWSGWMGSPSLLPLADRAIGLVSSNYTTYSDNGPGWDSYGGVTPVQWQYGVINNVDWNAFRGSLDQYLAMTGGNDVNLTDPISGTSTPGMGNRTAEQAWSDIWNVVMRSRTQGGGLWADSPFAVIEATLAGMQKTIDGLTAVNGQIMQLLTTGSGNPDTATVLTALKAGLDDVKATESATVLALRQQLAAAAKAEADALAAQG